jgi:hypothetical protein
MSSFTIIIAATYINVDVDHSITSLMTLSALRKLLPPSHSHSSPPHVSSTSLSPHSGTRRDRVALLDRTAAFLSTGTSSTSVQPTRDESIATLLRSYLTQPSHAPILSSLSSLLSTPILTSIASAVEKAPNRSTPQLSSLVTPHYHRSTLKALNFPISSTSYTSSRRHARTHGPGSPPPSPSLPPSKQPPSPTLLSALSSFLDDHSNPAACRVVKVNDSTVPARILSLRYAELHREWKKSNSSLRSLTAFIRAIRSLRMYKPVSKRVTDMCDHCMEGRRHAALLDKRMQTHQQSTCPFAQQVHWLLVQYQAIDTVPPLLSSIEFIACSCTDVSEDDVNAARALVSVVCFYHHHRCMKQQRHQLYRQHQVEVDSTDGLVIITIDYKENIKINTGPEEESRRFYNQAHRTVLGFLCQYKCGVTGRLVNHYVDYISPCLTHDAAFALECLQDLVTHYLLPRGLHHLHVWSDCGAHFRCKEMIAGVSVELPMACRHLNISLSVDLHFFVEKHGKSAVDGHFSLLSRWLQQAAAQRDIVSTRDLELALVEQSSSHLRSTRSLHLPIHRCDFRFYTPYCQEHSGSYHESLAPPSSSDPVPIAWSSDTACRAGLGTPVVESSLSQDGDELEASIPMLVDSDGDVEMLESQSSTTSLSFPSTASSPPSIPLSLSLSPEAETFPDVISVDDVAAVVAAAAEQSGKDECVTVYADVPVPSVTEGGSNERGVSRGCDTLPQLHRRVEGRVRCTRRQRRRPSITLPSSIALNTHYSWSCLSLPDVSSPSSPASDSPSSPASDSLSSSPRPSPSLPSSSPSPSTAAPMEQITTEELSHAIAQLPSPLSVTLSATVLPDSLVWPEQPVSAVFQSELCTDKKYIAFAPRLQAMPDVVSHPHAHSAMNKRLQSAHNALSCMKAVQACSMAAAFPD